MNGDEPLVPLLRSVLQGFAISPGDTVVVAVSGGIDSVVLLDLVVSAGYRSVVAAHIDHGIRSRSEREEDRRVVRDHADRLDVPFAERMIPEGLVESRAARSGESVEAIARSERYRLLREIAASIPADHPTILTAHHRDDQAETVLMRIVSGRSPFESLGIAPARSIPEEWSREKTGNSRESREAQTPSIRIVRPLLEVSRERLLRYAAERGLSWHTDSTNTDTGYLRNFLRHTVLPAIRSRFPGEIDSLARFADEVDRLRTAVTDRLTPEEWGESLPDGSIRWNRNRIAKMPRGAREVVLRRALKRVGSGERVDVRPCRDALERVFETGPDAAVDRSSATRLLSRVVYRNNSLECVLEGDALVVRPCIVRSLESGYLWVVPVGGTIVVRSGVPSEVLSGTPPDRSIRFISPVTPPVVVRSRRGGDRIRTEGRLRRAPSFPDEAFVVEDSDGIAAVFGIRTVLLRDRVTLRNDVTDNEAAVGVQTND